MEGDGCNLSEYISINRSLIFGVSSLNADYDTAYVIRGWISCFICGFGLIGNLLSIAVLTRPTLRALPINVILFCLTICDTIYILLYLISWSIPTIIARLAMQEGDTVQLDNYYMTHWRPRFYPYLYPSLWTAQNASIGFTLLLTIERYIYVCKPLESSKIITRRKTVIISLITALVFIIYELPLWWRFESIEILHHSPDCPTTLHYVTQKNKALHESTWFKAYNSKFKILVLHYVLPLIILFILNWKITSALKAIEKRRRRMTRSEARNISYTKIVICVISLSCVTDIVFSVVTVVSYLRDMEHGLYSQAVYVLLKDITDFLLLVNSSVNFVFYCLLGTAFKQEFLKLFCPFTCTKSLIVSDISESHGAGSARRHSTKE